MCASRSRAIALALVAVLFASAGAPAGRSALVGAAHPLRGAHAQFDGTARALRARLRPLRPDVRRLRGIERLLSVPFAFGGATLAPAARARVAQLARMLAAQSRVRVEVAGHADAVGSTAFNERLSLRRARSVCRALRRGGARRCTTQAFGERAPVARNRTPDGRDDPRGRARNRRAHFMLR